jgi:hypothetical protein
VDSKDSEMKGLSLRNYLAVLASLRGERVARDVVGLLSPELRDALRDGMIVPGGWYPVAFKRELHAAGRRVTGEPRLAWLMGSEMTRRDLHGIYRAFLRIVSPRHVLSLGSLFFGSYFRGPAMRVDENRRGYTHVTFTGCHGFDRNMWLDVIGGCEATLEAAGAKYVRMHIEDGGRDGDATSSITASWSGGETDSARP